jgi:cell division protease FtsH
MRWLLFAMNMNLKDIDQELARLRMRTGMLLQQKQVELKKITGLNFHNESDIESHLNREFDIPKNVKSEHFEVMRHDFTFKQIGGHDLIKEELMQCADVLTNHEKYSKFNVRTPKGLILEGPPGNGKTMLAKGFSGEIKVGFIPVSGSQFQEKYVGVGSARVRELFELAKNNVPCVIFMDEIDAIGRKRSTNENGQDHDSTLNELLVNLDGFKSCNGIFLMGATNRMDLLDDALLRPGRIDKKIYVGNPDLKTREAIIDLHIKGKPHHFTTQTVLDMTNGYSGAQLENLLNEAMLFALRDNREVMTLNDLEVVMNRMLVGFQSTKQVLTPEALYQVAVHEMGHALIGVLTKRKLIKVTINLWSPTSLGFTMFEPAPISTKESMIHEIMMLLGGRIAEEMLCTSITTGATHDFSQAKKLAEKMVLEYGMGNYAMIPHGSERYRERIDQEIDDILTLAYQSGKLLLSKVEGPLKKLAEQLVKDQVLKEDDIRNKLK